MQLRVGCTKFSIVRRENVMYPNYLWRLFFHWLARGLHHLKAFALSFSTWIGIHHLDKIKRKVRTWKLIPWQYKLTRKRSLANLSPNTLTVSDRDEFWGPFSTPNHNSDNPSPDSSGTGKGRLAGMYTTRNLNSSTALPSPFLYMNNSIESINRKHLTQKKIIKISIYMNKLGTHKKERLPSQDLCPCWSTISRISTLEEEPIFALYVSRKRNLSLHCNWKRPIQAALENNSNDWWLHNKK